MHAMPILLYLKEPSTKANMLPLLPPGAPTPQPSTPKPTLKDLNATCYLQFLTHFVATNIFTAENPSQHVAGVLLGDGTPSSSRNCNDPNSRITYIIATTRARSRVPATSLPPSLPDAISCTIAAPSPVEPL